MNPAQLIAAYSPLFHDTGCGRNADLGISQPVLDWLWEYAAGARNTLETGSGRSTVVFIARSARHIAIAPDPGEHQAIVDFCTHHGIATSSLEFHAARSQELLPGLSLPPLDIALIDGDHAFPLPFIDWYYIADAVRCGGYLLIDDTHLRTGRLLRQFIKAEPEWRLVRDIGKTCVFRKESDSRVTDKWWAEQPWGAITYPAPGDSLSQHLRHLRAHVRLRTRLRKWMARD